MTKKRLVIILSAVALAILVAVLSVIVIISRKDNKKTPSYVALGDSISAGFGLKTPEREGFASILAKDNYELTNLAISGNTASGILEQLKTDKVKASVKKADVVTITCGGNDLMHSLYTVVVEYYNQKHGTNYSKQDIMNELADQNSTDMKFGLTDLLSLVDIVDGFVDEPAFNEALELYKNNMFSDDGIIATLLSLNPDVKIVIATQYHPYAVFKDHSVYGVLYSGVKPCVEKLNSVIKENADKGYLVADVYTAFSNQKNNLCNADYKDGIQLDFHPNANGHKLIAEVFSKVIK